MTTSVRLALQDLLTAWDADDPTLFAVRVREAKQALAEFSTDLARPVPPSDVVPWLEQAILDFDEGSHRPPSHYVLVFRGAIREIERLRAETQLRRWLR